MTGRIRRGQYGTDITFADSGRSSGDLFRFGLKHHLWTQQGSERLLTPLGYALPTLAQIPTIMMVYIHHIDENGGRVEVQATWDIVLSTAQRVIASYTR